LRALQRLGFRLRRQTGSHAILRRDTPPRWTVVVPLHPELQRGTLRSILKQAHLSMRDLLDAID